MQIPLAPPEVFYVYEHVRPDTGGIFYVGKGKGDRCFVSSRHHRNSHWQRVVAKTGGFSVRKVAESLPEELAFLVEVERIDQLRRLRADLCNMTDGGDGTSGLIRTADHLRKMSESLRGRVVSKATREKLSKALKGKPSTITEEGRKKISDRHRGNQYPLGTKQSPDTIDRRRAKLLGNKSRSGQTRSAEERAKVSAALKGRNKPIFMCPHCLKSGGSGAMHRWHFDACKNKVDEACKSV
ncbi:NUMOD3 domain-containing DNA-binding protein [Burkholderia gladioli]